MRGTPQMTKNPVQSYEFEEFDYKRTQLSDLVIVTDHRPPNWEAIVIINWDWTFSDFQGWHTKGPRQIRELHKELNVTDYAFAIDGPTVYWAGSTYMLYEDMMEATSVYLYLPSYRFTPEK